MREREEAFTPNSEFWGWRWNEVEFVIVLSAMEIIPLDGIHQH
jgi:hypothetical protein